MYLDCIVLGLKYALIDEYDFPHTIINFGHCTCPLLMGWMKQMCLHVGLVDWFVWEEKSLLRCTCSGRDSSSRMGSLILYNFLVCGCGCVQINYPCLAIAIHTIYLSFREVWTGVGALVFCHIFSASFDYIK